MGGMSEPSRIHADPRVLCGKPVVRGTRVSVELILRKLSEGATVEDLLDAYPHLTVDDIRAAVAFAGDVVADDGIAVAGSQDSGKPRR